MNLFELFKRKEFRLVAIITSKYQRRYLGGAWTDQETSFFCYENEKGKRWFTMAHSSPRTFDSDIRKMHSYSILNGWKNHAHNLLKIPSFDAVRNGAYILIHES